MREPSHSSQYGEHTFILEYFGDKIGRFLDVGAFDGVTFSNTRHLADAGWSGVLVEPSPPAFCLLMKNYEGCERMTLVNAAITPEAALQPFHCNTADCHSADAMSTFSPEHRAKFKDYPFRDIWIPSITWPMFAERFCVHGGFDFVNIDVEALNVELLKAMPLRTSMVCIEMDPADAVPWMKQNLSVRGLTEQRVVGGNLLAWRPKQ